VQAVEIDRGKDVVQVNRHHRQLREQLHLATGESRIHAQLPRGHDEILLQDL
jgi:hypothetical protein